MKNLHRKVDQLRQHPLPGKNQYPKRNHQTRQEAQRLFVNLRCCLENTDAQADQQAGNNRDGRDDKHQVNTRCHDVTGGVHIHHR